MVSNPLRGLIDSQFDDNGNIVLAIIFFLLPTILLVAVRAMFGVTLDFVGLGLSVLREFIYFFLAVVLMYVLLAAFKGKDVKGRFSSILSAYSINYLVLFLFSLISFLLVMLFVPGFFETISALQGQAVGYADLYAVVSTMDLPDASTLLVLFGLMFLAGFMAVAEGLYVIYRIGQSVKETSSFSNLIFLLVFVVMAFLLNSFVTYALTLVAPA